LLPLTVAAALGGDALADKCKAPKVVIKNDKADVILVTKFQYFDGCDGKWRTEDVRWTSIDSGDSHAFTDDLEYVQNCKLPKFKVAISVSCSGAFRTCNQWSKELVPDQGTNVKCVTDAKYTVHLRD
jgi:hypothetical protein